MRSEAYKISPDTVAALKRLGLLAIIAFGSYAILSVSNLQVIRHNLCSPWTFFFMIILRSASVAIRCIALMFVLGLKTQDRRLDSKNETSSTLSNFSETRSHLMTRE